MRHAGRGVTRRRAAGHGPGWPDRLPCALARPEHVCPAYLGDRFGSCAATTAGGRGAGPGERIRMVPGGVPDGRALRRAYPRRCGEPGAFPRVSVTQPERTIVLA